MSEPGAQPTDEGLAEVARLQVELTTMRDENDTLRRLLKTARFDADVRLGAMNEANERRMAMSDERDAALAEVTALRRERDAAREEVPRLRDALLLAREERRAWRERAENRLMAHRADLERLLAFEPLARAAVALSAAVLRRQASPEPGLPVALGGAGYEAMLALVSIVDGLSPAMRAELEGEPDADRR